MRTGLRGRPHKLPAKSSDIETSLHDRKSLTDLISHLQGSDPDLIRFVVNEKKKEKGFFVSIIPIHYLKNTCLQYMIGRSYSPPVNTPSSIYPQSPSASRTASPIFPTSPSAYPSTSPAYQPSSPTYSPNSRTYTLTSPVYYPILPAYPSISPAYHTSYTVYYPTSPNYHPLSSNHRPVSITSNITSYTPFDWGRWGESTIINGIYNRYESDLQQEKEDIDMEYEPDIKIEPVF